MFIFPTIVDSKLLMRLQDNADLQNSLFVKKIPACVASDKLSDRLEVTYVVDGGAMLQSKSWPKSTSYFHLYILYIQFIHVQRHYLGALVKCTRLMAMEVTHLPRMRLTSGGLAARWVWMFISQLT